jgi:hypothetical protein
MTGLPTPKLSFGSRRLESPPGALGGRAHGGGPGKYNLARAAYPGFNRIVANRRGSSR